MEFTVETLQIHLLKYFDLKHYSKLIKKFSVKKNSVNLFKQMCVLIYVYTYLHITVSDLSQNRDRCDSFENEWLPTLFCMHQTGTYMNPSKPSRTVQYIQVGSNTSEVEWPLCQVH